MVRGGLTPLCYRMETMQIELPNDACLTPEEMVKNGLQADWKETGWGVLLPSRRGAIVLPLPKDEALSQFMADPDDAILIARNQVGYFSAKGWERFKTMEDL